MKVKLIKKQRIMEAPLMDILPSIKPKDYGKEEQPDQDRKEKLFASKKFHEKAKKLVQNLPVNIWVAPDIGKKFFSSRRVMILDLEYIKKIQIPEEDSYKKLSSLDNKGKTKYYKHWNNINRLFPNEEYKKYILDIVQTIPKEDCLLVVETEGEDQNFNFVSPWMILHAMFDNGIYFRNAPSQQIPEINKLTQHFKNINVILKRSVNPNIIKDPNKIISLSQNFESIFTFGSARKKFYSNIVKKGFESGEKIEKFETEMVISDDYLNESLAQCLTTNGFQYNKEAVINLPLPDHAKQKIIQILEEVKKLSPIVRQKFANLLKGKIIFINVG